MLCKILANILRFEIKAQPILIGRLERHFCTSKWNYSREQDRSLQDRKVTRPAVVTIMGHVDHGKTTLLDHLRDSEIVQQEFGGITQHIGAFVVPFKNEKSDDVELVTFLDTPGHAAFSSMRERGANITDIVILVIACEDGVMDQTIESINHAKNAKVPIIVAINKIDKYQNPKQLDSVIEGIRRQLQVHDVISELDGGDVQLVRMSAFRGVGVDDLKDCILALAETLQLRADISCPVRGRVIESRVDQHRGKLTTILVQDGVLKKGAYLLGGQHNWAKVRALFDERHQLRQECGPGMPIQVSGWREAELPQAGDFIQEVDSEAEARSMILKFKQEKQMKKAVEDAQQAEQRYEEYNKFYQEKTKERKLMGFRYGTLSRYVYGRGYRSKESFENDCSDRKVNLVLKCDVNGSLDALLSVLDTFDRDNKQPVKLDVMHHGVGNITENDFKLASSFKNSVIYGFNVKPESPKLMVQARKAGTEVKLFNVIYNLIDDLKAKLGAKIPEQEKEIEKGKARVMQLFIVKEKGYKKLHVAGSRCEQSPIGRDFFYKCLRDNQVIAEGMKVLTLKHLKDDVKSVEKNQEFGISFESHHDLRFRTGDVLVAYERVKYKPKLRWNLKGFS